MPDLIGTALPAQPNLDQLRHQAKDLLHAAQRGDSGALARIQKVSDRVILASAQLALAREYGFASWPKLKLEVERRDILNRRDLSRLTRLLAEHPELAVSRLEHWSDRNRSDPLDYITMMRFNHDRLGLPRELPGTGAIARALLQAGAPVNGNPGARETPLITAASYGDAEVARALIEAGADIEAVSAPNSGGVPSGTALSHAAVFGMTGVLDVLVAAGARVDSLEMAAAAGDITAWPLGRFTRQSRIRALTFAADHDRLEVIDQLVAAGTPVNEADAEWGRLPLHIAAESGRPASVRRLLSHGANPDLRDPLRGRTPLDCCQSGNRDHTSPAHDEVEAILRPLTGSSTRGGSKPPNQEPVGIQIRIEASDLPGRDFDPQSPDVPGGRHNVHVGVQRRSRDGELLKPQPGDAASAVWVFEATAVLTETGTDIKGPYIQGRPGGRFIYLSWVAADDTGTFTMFRRAKLMLDAVEPATLDAARRYGRLMARLKLTDAADGPLCAAVRPPLIRWWATPSG
jgi:ankyrin repeat protein